MGHIISHWIQLILLKKVAFPLKNFWLKNYEDRLTEEHCNVKTNHWRYECLQCSVVCTTNQILGSG